MTDRWIGLNELRCCSFDGRILYSWKGVTQQLPQQKLFSSSPLCTQIFSSLNNAPSKITSKSFAIYKIQNIIRSSAAHYTYNILLCIAFRVLLIQPKIPVIIIVTLLCPKVWINEHIYFLKMLASDSNPVACWRRCCTAWLVVDVPICLLWFWKKKGIRAVFLFRVRKMLYQSEREREKKSEKSHGMLCLLVC